MKTPTIPALRPVPKFPRGLRLVAAILAPALTGFAQTVSPPVDVVELSPFIVSTKGDDGYRAANTLSGTRMNSSLLQTPAAISVLTKEFLDDIGAENTLDMLKFGMSSDHERTDPSGGLQQAFDVRPSIRGFSEASITRDYLPNMIQSRGILASDRFNVDRADLSRGPNSILYGASRPGGAINTSSKRAVLNGQQKSISLAMGSFAKKRSEMDLAFPLIKDKLALRTNTLLEDREGWFEFEMLKQKGQAVAVTYQPFKSTQVRAGVERVIKDQVLGGNYPQSDFGYSRWVMAGSPMAGDPLLPGTNPAPALLSSANILQVTYAPQIRPEPFRLSTTGADMRPDLPGNQPSGFWQSLAGAAAPAGGTVDDPYYGQLIPANANLSGPGRTANTSYTLASVFIDQRIGGVNIELGYARTWYHRGFSQNVSNAMADPNPVLPGAYYADGDSVIAAGRDPGTLLPDIGRKNPFAGMPYVQSNSNRQHFDQTDETLRASVGYELNLEKHHDWLGRHSFAGFWQWEDNLLNNYTEQEYNLTPKNSQPIDSATNIIWRRTYLDFKTPGGVHGALDPLKNPIPVSPSMKAGFVSNASYPWVSQQNTSWMMAMQSKFLSERLVFTGGYRRDKVVVNDASSGGERLPNSTNLWRVQNYIFDPATATTYEGATKTMGAVLMPLSWLGFSYNQSQSVFPQGNFKDILNHVLKPIEGDGKDYGVRFNLLGGRLSANVNLYDNLGANQFQVAYSTPRGQAVPALNAILNTLRARGQALPPSLVSAGVTLLEQVMSRETADYDGKGSEIELTGRLTQGWSISLNYSRNKLVLTNVAPDMNGFLATMKDGWDGNASLLIDTPATVATFVRTRDNTPGRDFVANPASFNDTYDYAVSVMDPINKASGKAPMAHIEERFNVFSSYRFDDAPWSILRRSRIGLGANYRGPAVIGYDAANGNMPFTGKSSVVASLMLGKRFPLRKGQAIDVQLNIENLFKQEDLLPYSAVSPGNVVRYILPATRQNWTLRGTYSF